MSRDCLHTVSCACVLWAVCFHFYHHNLLPLWLTSCSICSISIKETDHINCIDWTAIWRLLRTRHIWFPFGVQYITSRKHTYMYIQDADSFHMRFPEDVWVIQPSTVCTYVYFCVWLLCIFFIFFLCPFSSTFICPPEGRGLTTGWGSMNCCVVLSQRRILFRSPPGG